MAEDITLTVCGNITKDIELKYIGNNRIVNFTVAHSERRWDSSQRKNVEVGSTYINCVAFGRLAENIANNLSKGQRVVATGTFRQHTYTTAAGEQRSIYELTVQDIGASVLFAHTECASNGNGGSSATGSDSTANGGAGANTGTSTWTGVAGSSSAQNEAWNSVSTVTPKSEAWSSNSTNLGADPWSAADLSGDSDYAEPEF